MIFTKIKQNRHLIYMFAFVGFISCSKSIKLKMEDSTDPTETVLLISFDGFKWNYIDNAKTPNFDEFISDGVKAEGLIPSFPSKTFPSHITLVTGRHPSKHGIVSNRMFDPVFNEYYYIGQNSKPVLDSKWYEAEPIWVTAEKQNKRAMTMFWPASEAEIMGTRPTEFFIYDESISNTSRIDQVVEWLDYPEEKRGKFFSLYFSDLDSQGHRFGPDSDEVRRTTENMDALIGRLIKSLKARKIYDKINIIITTDHGMASTSKDSMIFLDDYIDMNDIEVVDWGPACSILPKVDVDSIYSRLVNAHPMLDVFKKGNLPDELHYNDHNRIQPIMAIAKEHWTVSNRKSYNDNPERFDGGNHGYYSTYESMRGIFFARGPGFKKGFTGPGFSSIHLYELMCHLLKIVPTDNDGYLDSTKIYLSENK